MQQHQAEWSNTFPSTGWHRAAPRRRSITRKTTGITRRLPRDLVTSCACRSLASLHATARITCSPKRPSHSKVSNARFPTRIPSAQPHRRARQAVFHQVSHPFIYFSEPFVLNFMHVLLMQDHHHHLTVVFVLLISFRDQRILFWVRERGRPVGVSLRRLRGGRARRRGSPAAAAPHQIHPRADQPTGEDLHAAQIPGRGRKTKERTETQPVRNSGENFLYLFIQHKLCCCNSFFVYVKTSLLMHSD